MADYREAFVGIDVAKLRNAIAIADAGGEGEVRFFGEVDAPDGNMRRVIERITARFDRVHFCYEAGPTGYGLYRLIRSLGHECTVVAPSLIPKKPGDRVKTNRRDALSLSRLLRAGELTAVWVPDESHEAMRISSAPGRQRLRRFACIDSRCSRMFWSADERAANVSTFFSSLTMVALAGIAWIPEPERRTFR